MAEMPPEDLDKAEARQAMSMELVLQYDQEVDFWDRMRYLIHSLPSGNAGDDVYLDYKPTIHYQNWLSI